MKKAAASVPVSAIILAGGRSERLGRDKATLGFGRTTLSQHVVDLASGLSNDVIVVIRADQRLQVSGARLVTDADAYVGPLAGIAGGLVTARHEWSVVVACDMPFIDLSFVSYMISQTPGYDAVVPRLEVGLEPLYALYRKRCLPSLWRALESGRRRVVSFYTWLRVRYIDPSEIDLFDPARRSFHNINTADELERAREQLEQNRPNSA